MCPTDGINLSEAPRCLVQHAICPKLDPKLHMPAAACEGLRQTMSDTMGLAVPLAERLSCQRHKKPHARRRQKVWLRGEFILSDSFAWKAFHFSSLSVTSLFMLDKKKSCPLPEAPAEARSPDQCVQAGETAWQRLGDKFFWGGRIFASQEMHYCTSKQTVPLCWRVWRPLEPWTKPAGPLLRLAWNQKQCVRQGKHFQKTRNLLNEGTEIWQNIFMIELLWKSEVEEGLRSFI